MKMEPLAKGHSHYVGYSCEVTLCLFSSSFSSFFLGGGGGEGGKMVLFIFAIACKKKYFPKRTLSFLFYWFFKYNG